MSSGNPIAFFLQMWTKLRPNVRQFLQTAAQFYELWIHTNGAVQGVAQIGSKGLIT